MGQGSKGQERGGGWGEARRDKGTGFREGSIPAMRSQAAGFEHPTSESRVKGKYDTLRVFCGIPSGLTRPLLSGSYD